VVRGRRPFHRRRRRLYRDERAGAARFLGCFAPRRAEPSVGSISGIVDSEPPYTTRGDIG